MIHQKHLKDTVDRVAANTLEPITRNSFKNIYFWIYSAHQEKTEKDWTASQSVFLSINTISTLRVR